MLFVQNKLTFLGIFFPETCLASSYSTIVVTLTRNILERQGKQKSHEEHKTPLQTHLFEAYLPTGSYVSALPSNGHLPGTEFKANYVCSSQTL